MNFVIHERENVKFLECLEGQEKITGERDALDWIATCGECGTDRLLLHASNLPPEFFQLRSGVAGEILQKFAVYRVRLAAILTPMQVNQGRFREMVLEAHRGSQFRVFFDRASAEEWLSFAGR